MLIEATIKRLKSDFPNLIFSINDSMTSITVPPKNADVGPVSVEEYCDELIVYIGSFTHWHVGSYDRDLSDIEKADEIARSVSIFLAELFVDNIVFWKGNRRGGFYRVGEKPNSKSCFGKQYQEWVWSGRRSSPN